MQLQSMTRVSLLLLLGVAGHVAAAGERYGVEPNRSADVELDVDLLPVDPRGRPRSALARSAQANVVHLDDAVHVCFSASRTGYVSVWDVDADGNFTRILPNTYSHPDGASGVRVTAARKTCGGRAEGGYKFVVAEPVGPSQIYVHWSADEAGQIRPDDYVTIGRSAARKAGVPMLGDDYAAYYLQYEVKR